MSSFASVCPGVSLERAFDRSDVVVEVELIPNVRAKELVVPLDPDAYQDNEEGYLIAGLPLAVSKVWKGKQSKKAEIYVHVMSTFTYVIEEREKHVIFANYFDPKVGTISQEIDVVEDYHLLFTGSCMGNKIIKEDETSRLVKAKLDRIQEEAIRLAATREHAGPLREFIRGVFKSNKERISAIDRTTQKSVPSD